MKSASTKEQLYKQYVTPNFGYCKNVVSKYLGTGDFAETISLVQLHLYHNIQYYDPNKPLLTWLHVCIKRYVNGLNKDNWKDLIEKVSINENKGNGGLSDLPSSKYFETGNFDELGSLYFTDSLYCSLKALKPIDREIILLHYIDGYDFRAIAKMKHLTLSQVKGNAYLSLLVMRYKLTGRKPPKAPIYKYFEKAFSLNNAI